MHGKLTSGRACSYQLLHTRTIRQAMLVGEGHGPGVSYGAVGRHQSEGETSLKNDGASYSRPREKDARRTQAQQTGLALTRQLRPTGSGTCFTLALTAA